MEFFSSNYATSRRKFRQLARDAGANLTVITHPAARGPAGENLSVEVAVFGRSPASKVFVDLNGVHGNEAPAGAAGQLRWMADGALRRLPDDVAVILVHTLNPYGWAHESQLTEDAVNLNRNFINFSAPPPSDPLHLDIARALAFRELTFAAAADAWARILEIGNRVGQARFGQALMAGQFIARRGLNFGGDKPAWSNDVLRAIVRDHLARAEAVVVADWHTGLGAYGEPTPLHRWEEGSDAWRWTERMWGRAVMERGRQGMVSGAGEDAPLSAFAGPAVAAVFDAAPHAAQAGGIIEFGTAEPFDLIAQAAILDLWLVLDAPGRGLDTRFWRAQMRTFFGPRDADWEQSVLRHGAELRARMLGELIAW